MFNFLINRKINSALKNNDRKHTMKNMDGMHNILIFFSYSDWEEVYSIALNLEKKGKKITMWTIQPHTKDPSVIIFPENVRIIRPNEKSLLNILSTSVVDEFRSLSYDTLIDLTTTHSNTFKYLLAQNKSEFSIGISESVARIYDFIVLKEENKSLRETFDQIKFYLSNVR